MKNRFTLPKNSCDVLFLFECMVGIPGRTSVSLDPSVEYKRNEPIGDDTRSSSLGGGTARPPEKYLSTIPPRWTLKEVGDRTIGRHTFNNGATQPIMPPLLGNNVAQGAVPK